MPPVNTKTAPRRDTSFATLADIAADLDSLEAAHAAGTLTHTGNWTPGQVFEHCALVMRGSLDGFEARAPAPLRLLARLLFKKQSVDTDKPMPAGFKLPRQASSIMPQPGRTFEDGLALLRAQLDRVGAGQRFEKPSPVLGPLTHEQWDRLHRKHCAMHLSFLHPGQPGTTHAGTGATDTSPSHATTPRAAAT